MNEQYSNRSFWEGRSVLITGGAGFIGSNLARRLVNLGSEVTIVDSLISKYGGNLYNLDGYESRLKINLCDIRDTSSMEALLYDKSVLFNLAGQTSHLDSMTDPYTDLEINCIAQLTLLESCRKVNPLVRIIFASTRQIYGKPEFLPVSELHKSSPVDINGIHKLSAELYHSIYSKFHDLSTCTLRLTNTIGPRMRIKDDRQTFLGIWIRRLLEDEPIQVWGGTQIRDFNDVDDVLDALMLAAMSENLDAQPYNLGSKEVVNLTDLANQLIRIHGSGKLNLIEYPKTRMKIDIGDFYSSYDRFQDATSWQPKTSLYSTLKRTLDYYKSNLPAYI